MAAKPLSLAERVADVAAGRCKNPCGPLVELADIVTDLERLAELAERMGVTPARSEAEQTALTVAVAAVEYIGGFYDEREPDEAMRNFRRECCDVLATLRALEASDGK